MAANTLTTLDGVLKELYKGQTIAKTVYQDFPFLGLLNKMENFVGRVMPFPLLLGEGQGRSATFSDAKGNVSADLYDQWEIKTVSNYGLATISGEAADLASGDGAFLEGLTENINNSLHGLTRDIARNLWLSKTGSIGSVGSVSTTVVTLATKEDIVNFERGMELVATATDGAASARSGSATITAVDRSAGTITTDANWTGQITGFTAGDYLVVEGDLNKKISGVSSWIPATAPSGGDSHFGVDRSVDPDRYAGVRYDGSGMPIREALLKGVAQVGINGGGRPSHIFLHPMDMQDLAITMTDNVVYDMAKDGSGKKVANIGFAYIAIPTPAGIVKVISDPGVPKNVAFGLDLATWKLVSKGKVPKILDRDGLRIMRMADEDGYQVRVGSRAQLVCTRPGANCRIKLA